MTKQIRMDKWEYEFLDLYGLNNEFIHGNKSIAKHSMAITILRGEADALGEEGWEMVHYSIGEDDLPFFIFKRKKLSGMNKECDYCGKSTNLKGLCLTCKRRSKDSNFSVYDALLGKAWGNFLEEEKGLKTLEEQMKYSKKMGDKELLDNEEFCEYLKKKEKNDKNK